ncbi:MAG: hypothetical protein ABL900_11485, partial [Burkholderiaceae bacterium]
EPAEHGQDGLSISHRSIAQASDLAAGARDGEVLVSPQLASLLVESGLSFHSKEIHLPGGRMVPACSLDLTGGLVEKANPVGRSPIEGKVTEALVRIYQTLMSQAGEMARKQADLEARLDVALRRTVPADDDASAPDTHPGELAAGLETRHVGVHERLQSIGALDARISTLQQSASDAEGRLAEVLARHGEIDDLRTRCDTLATQLTDAQRQLGDMAILHEQLQPLASQVAALLQSLETIDSRRETEEEVQSRADTLTHMLGDVNLKLEMLSEQRAAVDHVGEQLARLDYTVQEAQRTLRALQREREVAERVEQGIKALRQREGAPKLI